MKVVRAAQSDFVPGSAIFASKLCLLGQKQERRVSHLTYPPKSYARTEAWPSSKLCIAASQSEISDFGQNPDQMPYLVRKSSEIITAGLKIFGG